MKKSMVLCFLVMVVIFGVTNSFGQTVFFDDWESGEEWSADFKGVGEADKGEVNGHIYCGHYNMWNEKQMSGVRSGFIRALSHSSLPGPPNEAWTWRRAAGLTAGAAYKLSFYVSPDETVPLATTFYAFGYTQNLTAVYGGSHGFLGQGIPQGMDYPDGSSGWSLDGTPNTSSMTQKLAIKTSQWFKYEKEFVAAGPEIRLWGIAQNLESEETHAGYFVEDVKVDYVGFVQPTATNTPNIPSPTPTSPETGCTSYRGDADCSGSITPGDALKAFNFFLGAESPTTSPCDQACAADADLSGSITPGDALCIFNIFLGAGDCI